MGDVGQGIASDRANWHFSGDVAKNFDAHVSKSVPLYAEGHKIVCDLSDFFIKPESLCYEIGCSTGALISRIADYNRNKDGARFIGIDVEADMIEVAKEGRVDGAELEFVHGDALELEFEPCDLIVCYYTIQFIRPSVRQNFIDKCFQHLNWGGALLMFEKVRGPDARFQDIVSQLYNDYKLSQGYTPEEIIAKARSLKGVLEPFSSQANVEMLQRAGFVDMTTIMKYLCFEGLVAIK